MTNSPVSREKKPSDLRTRWAPLCLIVAVGWLGCANRALPPPPEASVLERDAYVIGAADVVHINVWRNPELSLGVPVRPDGKISVPLLDDVQAAGLTPEELKEHLTRLLGEYVSNPDVTVVVTQVNSKRVYILRESGNSSAVPLNQDMRVLDLIAATGGFGQFADKDNIRILRRSGGSIMEYRFDYDQFLKGRSPEGNILLQPGDTVLVPE